MTLTVSAHVHGPAMRRLVRVVGTAMLCGGIVMLVLGFAPTAVGGAASYVITDGVSMLPKFHGDGLVITRREPQYHVGEVVAYHNKELGAVVMHRIVAKSGDRYVFKGDNNDFRDHYHPTGEELVGQEWIYWPGAGRYLLMLREPWVFATIAAGLTLLSFRRPNRSRNRRRHHAL